MFDTKVEPQNRLLNKDKIKFLLNESDSTAMKLEGVLVWQIMMQLQNIIASNTNRLGVFWWLHV